MLNHHYARSFFIPARCQPLAETFFLPLGINKIHSNRATSNTLNTNKFIKIQQQTVFLCVCVRVSLLLLLSPKVFFFCLQFTFVRCPFVVKAHSKRYLSESIAANKQHQTNKDIGQKLFFLLAMLLIRVCYFAKVGIACNEF